jgi:hypothetical protein
MLPVWRRFSCICWRATVKGGKVVLVVVGYEGRWTLEPLDCSGADVIGTRSAFAIQSK